MKQFLLISLLFLLNGCYSIRVYSDFDSEANFNSYMSFAFYKAGIDQVEISDIDKKRILKAIEENLKSKQLVISETPDLLINISTESSENIYIDNSFYNPYFYGWSPFYFGNGYRRISHSTSEGVLYIDIIDAKSKQLIWQGKGIGYLDNRTENRDEMISNYVNKILAYYPPGSEKIKN